MTTVGPPVKGSTPLQASRVTARPGHWHFSCVARYSIPRHWVLILSKYSPQRLRLTEPNQSQLPGRKSIASVSSKAQSELQTGEYSLRSAVRICGSVREMQVHFCSVRIPSQ